MSSFLFLHRLASDSHITPMKSSPDRPEKAVGARRDEVSEVAYVDGMRKLRAFVLQLSFEERQLRAHRIAAEVRHRRGMNVRRIAP